MIAGAFLALYGLLFISGLFMLPAWVGIARVARAQGDADYATVANALALNSLGTILIFGIRLLYGFRTGNWSFVGGILGGLILFGMLVFELSKILLMLVRRRHGHTRTWRAYAIASVLWSVFAIVWTLLRMP